MLRAIRIKVVDAVFAAVCLQLARFVQGERDMNEEGKRGKVRRRGGKGEMQGQRGLSE